MAQSVTIRIQAVWPYKAAQVTGNVVAFRTNGNTERGKVRYIRTIANGDTSKH